MNCYWRKRMIEREKEKRSERKWECTSTRTRESTRDVWTRVHIQIIKHVVSELRHNLSFIIIHVIGNYPSDSYTYRHRHKSGHDVYFPPSIEGQRHGFWDYKAITAKEAIPEATKTPKAKVIIVPEPKVLADLAWFLEAGAKGMKVNWAGCVAYNAKVVVAGKVTLVNVPLPPQELGQPVGIQEEQNVAKPDTKSALKAPSISCWWRARVFWSADLGFLLLAA